MLYYKITPKHTLREGDYFVFMLKDNTWKSLLNEVEYYMDAQFIEIRDTTKWGDIGLTIDCISKEEYEYEISKISED